MLASLLASLASGETVVALRRARRAAVVSLFAGVFALCGLGFFVAALYIWLAARYGRFETALSFAGVFIAIAVVIILFDRLTARARAVRDAERRKSELTAVGVASALTILPGLLRSRAGLGLLIAPLVAAAGYALYRENQRRRDRRPY
jgi:undecaprenyl pyrophosphate phosphatase UppP